MSALAGFVIFYGAFFCVVVWRGGVTAEEFWANHVFGFCFGMGWFLMSLSWETVAALLFVAFLGWQTFFPARSHLTLFQGRSFFGVLRVMATRSGSHHFLVHGTTVHGGQVRTAGQETLPITYYPTGSPIAKVLRAMQTGKRGRRIGVVGLGTGALAAYSRPWQEWTFFEIDPLVERVARNPEFFSFLSACPARWRILTGDARLTLEGLPAGGFDLLVIDAYSSDAIPTHLLTREAFQLYLSRLAPDGILVLHLSNWYFSLDRVVYGITRDLGLPARRQDFDRDAAKLKYDDEHLSHVFSSSWIMVARQDAHFGRLLEDPGWKDVRPTDRIPLWTDEHSSLWPVIRW